MTACSPTMGAFILSAMCMWVSYAWHSPRCGKGLFQWLWSLSNGRDLTTDVEGSAEAKPALSPILPLPQPVAWLGLILT